MGTHPTVDHHSQSYDSAFEGAQGDENVVDLASFAALPRSHRAYTRDQTPVPVAPYNATFFAEHVLKTLQLCRAPAVLPTLLPYHRQSAAESSLGGNARSHGDTLPHSCKQADQDAYASPARVATQADNQSEQDDCTPGASTLVTGGQRVPSGHSPDVANHLLARPKGTDVRNGGEGADAVPPEQDRMQEVHGLDTAGGARPSMGTGSSGVRREWDPGPCGEPLREAPLGLLPVLAAYVTPDRQRLYIVYEYVPDSLGALLRYSPSALRDSSEKGLVLLQLLTALQAVHNKGLWYRSLSVDDIFISEHRCVVRHLLLLVSTSAVHLIGGREGNSTGVFFGLIWFCVNTLSPMCT